MTTPMRYLRLEGDLETTLTADGLVRMLEQTAIRIADGNSLEEIVTLQALAAMITEGTREAPDGVRGTVRTDRADGGAYKPLSPLAVVALYERILGDLTQLVDGPVAVVELQISVVVAPREAEADAPTDAATEAASLPLVPPAAAEVLAP